MTGEKPVAFVAEGQIPPSPPPVRTGGALGWARDNLFSGIFNTVATLLSLVFVAYVLALIVPWLFLDSVWNASSLQGCRAVDDGACLAVINERFLQFVFGFYPDELRWRPVNWRSCCCSFAIWPALFERLRAAQAVHFQRPRYPLLAYWLIWGGSLWGPVGVIAGPAIGWACIRFLPPLARGRLDEGLAFLAAAGAGILATCALVAVRRNRIRRCAERRAGDRSRAGGVRQARRVPAVHHHRRLRHCGLAAHRHRACARAAVPPDPHQGVLRRVHRVHPRRAADHAALRRLAAAFLLPAAGHGIRPDPAGGHHGDGLCVGLYGGGHPRRPRGAADGAVRSRRCRSGSTTGSPCA